MNIRKLQKGLKYRGQVAGLRQTYHVFEASDYFLILSFALSSRAVDSRGCRAGGL